MIKTPKSSPSSAHPEPQAERSNGKLRDWVSRSPILAFVVVAAVLLTTESVSAWRLIEWYPVLKPVEPLIETVLDLVVVLPVLLFLFVLPGIRNLRQREAAEAALRAEREKLVLRVRERTAELEDSNRRLREQIDRGEGARMAIEFQASLLDAVEQAVVALDSDGRILYANRFAGELYGWQLVEATGRPLAAVLTFLDSDGSRLTERKRRELGASWSGEAEAVRLDGSRLPVYLAWSPLIGEEHGCVCISFDITESKAVREALRDSEEKYSSLVESSPTGIFIFQKDRFLFVNPRFAELLEYPRDDLLEADPWLLVHPDHRESVAEIMRKRAAGEPVPEEYECQLVAHSDQVRWVTMRNTRIRYQGAPAVLGNVQDITERKRMEAELHLLSARLLGVQEEERRRLARDLHDSLGQKLTGVKFLIEAALGQPRPDERRAGMGQLHALVPTIQDAVEEVRRISTELRPSILDDLGLLPTIAWHLREFEKAHPGFVVEQRLGVTESEVPDGLRTPIYRVLQEASNNVAKHSGTSRMVVGLECDDGKLCLSVQDDGVGFDPETPLRAAGSQGLGMGSMRERTELTGGTFSVRSSPGGGTTIRAEWPLNPPLPDEPVSG